MFSGGGGMKSLANSSLAKLALKSGAMKKKSNEKDGKNAVGPAG
jgi:hypothetical protein